MTSSLRVSVRDDSSGVRTAVGELAAGIFGDLVHGRVDVHPSAFGDGHFASDVEELFVAFVIEEGSGGYFGVAVEGCYGGDDLVGLLSGVGVVVEVVQAVDIGADEDIFSASAICSPVMARTCLSGRRIYDPVDRQCRVRDQAPGRGAPPSCSAILSPSFHVILSG